MTLRFVSHEMRTPMNTVSMGLQLLRKKLEVAVRDRTQRAEALSVIEDVELSVANAIEVLNDILTCDKIEKGILTLDKATHVPRQLVEQTCQPFYIQVGAAICCCRLTSM